MKRWNNGKCNLCRSDWIYADGRACADVHYQNNPFLPDGCKGGKAVLVTKIKEYRENTDMKQAELAELVKARRETTVHLENGKYNPSLKLAMDIAKVLGFLLNKS